MGRKLIDLTGKKVHEWTVIERATPFGESPIYWRCQCSCGVRRKLLGYTLRRGETNSCGHIPPLLPSKLPAADIKEQTCMKCEEVRPISMFRTYKAIGKRMYRHVCKDCEKKARDKKNDMASQSELLANYFSRTIRTT